MPTPLTRPYDSRFLYYILSKCRTKEEVGVEIANIKEAGVEETGMPPRKWCSYDAPNFLDPRFLGRRDWNRGGWYGVGGNRLTSSENVCNSLLDLFNFGTFDCNSRLECAKRGKQ